MSTTPVIIIGAGTIGKIALENYQSNEVEVYCFLDEDETLIGTEISNVTVLGKPDDEQYLKILGKDCDLFVASDENEYKRSTISDIKESHKVIPNNSIHNTAYISPNAEIGHGNLIAAKATINGFASIGNFNNINASSIVDATAQIGDYVQIGAGAIVNSGVIIEDNAFIGSGSILISGVKIGEGARIGAGSVVISSVKSGKTVFGNPAKEM